MRADARIPRLGALAPVRDGITLLYACGRDARAPVVAPVPVVKKLESHHRLRARRPRTQAPALPRWITPLPAGARRLRTQSRRPRSRDGSHCCRHTGETGREPPKAVVIDIPLHAGGRDARAPRRLCRDAHRSRKPGTSRNAHWTGPDTHASPRSRPGILSPIAYVYRLSAIAYRWHVCIFRITMRFPPPTYGSSDTQTGYQSLRL